MVGEIEMTRREVLMMSCRDRLCFSASVDCLGDRCFVFKYPIGTEVILHLILIIGRVL